MANSTTFSFTGSVQSWTVPSRVQAVQVECYGAGTSTANGGYSKGVVPVSPGDTLYLYVGGSNSGVDGGWPNGGDGGSKNYDNGYSSGTMEGAGGAGSSDVRLNVDQRESTIVSAGGAGGQGNQSGWDQSPDYESNARDGDETGGAKGNGGNASNASTPHLWAAGGDAGASGNWWGGHGGSDKTGGYGRAMRAAAGGGGGGGFNGGSGGQAKADYYGSNWIESVAAGGGGGRSHFDSSVTNTTNTRGGGSSGDGQIVLTYDEPPLEPSNLAASLSDFDVTLTWTDNSGDEEEFRIYRGPDTSSLSQIATVGAGVTSYVDTPPSTGENYYYGVTAYKSGIGTESATDTTSLFYTSGPYTYDGSTFSRKQVYYYDGSTWQPGVLKQYNGSTWEQL
jgi:hypothetical protein